MWKLGTRGVCHAGMCQGATVKRAPDTHTEDASEVQHPVPSWLCRSPAGRPRLASRVCDKQVGPWGGSR